MSTVALTSASISLPLRGCRAFEQFSLRKKFAFRRFTPTHHGGSEALLVGTHCPATGEFRLTITAATVRPIQLRFEKKVPAAEELRRAIDDSLPFDTYCERTIFTVPHALHPSPF